MHILITRPQEDAAELAADLSARGIDVSLEPLLTIQPVPSPAIDLDGVQAILFTSANGVRCFAAAHPRRDIKVFAVGDNSAAQATALGFADVTSAEGDVASLAKLVTDRLHPRDGALLHAAGASLAGDLRGQLQAAGFVIRRVVLYDAVPVTALTPATVMNLRLGGIDAVALFSPRTARCFAGLWQAEQNHEADGLKQATALCLGEAVAAEVRDLGWQRVVCAARPDRAGMLALIAQEQKRRETAMASTGQESTAESAQESASSAEDMPGDGDVSAREAGKRGAAIIAAAPNAPRAGRAGALFLGLVAGALAGGAMVVAEPYWRPYIPLAGTAAPTDTGADTSGLAAEIAALKEQLATLEGSQDVDAEARRRIEALQSEITTWKSELETATGQSAAAQTATIDLAPLEGRLEALEARLASLSAELAQITATAGPSETAGAAGGDSVATPPTDTDAMAALAARFAALEAKLGALDRLAAEAATQQAEIDAAKARLADLGTLDSRLKSLEETAASLGSDFTALAEDQGETALQRQRAAALVLMVGQLRASLGTDKPFEAELAALEDLARADGDLAARMAPILDPLRPSAAAGVPTLTQLQAELPATAIAQAATADAAGAAIGAEANWLQQTLNRLSELITVRPVGDVAGEGALAALARAEARLAAGNLADAVAEIDTLSGQAADIAAPWRARASARLAADTAAVQLATFSAEALVPLAAPAQSN
ncbi:MAG: uroporphyrinogen-III synthase [Rhodospirillaceae bacterium]|nr:uroporphyrinogen-III synthase [Rhodospirillaceae bacterium]